MSTDRTVPLMENRLGLQERFAVRTSWPRLGRGRHAPLADRAFPIEPQPLGTEPGGSAVTRPKLSTDCGHVLSPGR